MKTRSDDEPALSDVAAAESPVDCPKHVEGAERKRDGKAYAAKTRPAPKPAVSRARNEKSAPKLADDELTYEPMDDNDNYYADDEDGGTAPPSA